MPRSPPKCIPCLALEEVGAAPAVPLAAVLRLAVAHSFVAPAELGTVQSRARAGDKRNPSGRIATEGICTARFNCTASCSHKLNIFLRTQPFAPAGSRRDSASPRTIQESDGQQRHKGPRQARAAEMKSND